VAQRSWTKFIAGSLSPGVTNRNGGGVETGVDVIVETGIDVETNTGVGEPTDGTQLANHRTMIAKENIFFISTAPIR
jgi:hypothetical protein